MAEITIDSVGKTYPDGTEAVKDVDLDVADRSLMVLVGPSGCGKTTLLRMVAGLEDITEGSIRIGDRVVNEVPPKDRDIVMVFQNYALYPHMSVYDNMAYGLKLRKTSKSEIKKLVTETSEILGLRDLLQKKPRELSGGQRQRVAMGRAIVRQPKAFLMDEPLSNLDAKLRVQMRTEISRIQRQVGVTTIYVTHDQTEAMTMGDRVAVMRNGEVQQVNSPQELYDHPDNLFVAGFIGSPAMNFVSATLERTGDDVEVSFGSIRLRVNEPSSSLNRSAGGQIIVGIRPEDFEDAAIARDVPAEERISVQIELREAMGSEVYAYFTLDAAPVVTEEIKEIAADAGDVVEADLERAVREASTTFVARLNSSTTIQEGSRAELVVNTNKLHFFDLDGNAIRNGHHR